MRFIDKSKRCKEFDDFIKNPNNLLGKWNLPTDIKTALHNHLIDEQKSLCIYCQQTIHKKIGWEFPPKSSIEHIIPRGKYPGLTYIYCNLSVVCKSSANPKTAIHGKGKKRLFCEEVRYDEYNEDKFLNPIELADIEDYFEYNVITGEIIASNKNLERADYMIGILNLNNTVLTNMRKEKYDEVRNDVDNSKISDIHDFLDPNYDELPPFYSMLKAAFKNS